MEKLSTFYKYLEILTQKEKRMAMSEWIVILWTISGVPLTSESQVHFGYNSMLLAIFTKIIPYFDKRKTHSAGIARFKMEVFANVKVHLKRLKIYNIQKYLKTKCMSIVLPFEKTKFIFVIFSFLDQDFKRLIFVFAYLAMNVSQPKFSFCFLTNNMSNTV